MTRPDLTYSVHVLAQFMQTPREDHWHAALRVVRYLKGSPCQGVLLRADDNFQINGWSDSDWASCPLTRRSVTGYFVQLGNSPISWKTKKQHTVSLSSAEAEYRAMAYLTKELIWLKRILQPLGVNHNQSMRLYCDSKAALHIGNNPVFHERTKHIELDCHFIRDEILAGTIATSQEAIKSEAERFFQDFLSHVPTEIQGISVEEMQKIIPFCCSEGERSQLIKPVTSEEIKEVMFKMPSNKSLGPDGFTSEFFKASWSIIGNDFIVAVQSFFMKGFLPKGLNTTILALIPKKEAAIEIRDYRPISCCNVLYKVISKIIANRLKGTLPQCISPNQSAFVRDRLLVENLLLATEIVKDYHKEDISPRCAMKIDIAKAFDSVHWPFMLNTLKALNMPEKFVHWIELFVCTPSFSVQVNGELAGFFQSKRGLRQGCALSPYLFVICMNVLSHLLDKSTAQKIIGYHPRCQNILLTHLCFADDLLVFTDGTKRSIEGILKIFEEFAHISGLKISLENSTLYTAGISVD